MGARLVKFDIYPNENEQIEAVVNVPEEKRSVIHGIVKDCKGKVVKDAVVKLFEVTGNPKNCILTPITHTFTDECGQFIFGPLCPRKRYTIKVWFNDVVIREIIVSPDEHMGRCLSGDTDERPCDDSPHSRNDDDDDDDED